jgi:hypothetical protein
MLTRSVKSSDIDTVRARLTPLFCSLASRPKINASQRNRMFLLLTPHLKIALQQARRLRQLLPHTVHMLIVFPGSRQTWSRPAPIISQAVHPPVREIPSSSATTGTSDPIPKRSKGFVRRRIIVYWFEACEFVG